MSWRPLREPMTTILLSLTLRLLTRRARKVLLPIGHKMSQGLQLLGLKFHFMKILLTQKFFRTSQQAQELAYLMMSHFRSSTAKVVLRVQRINPKTLNPRLNHRQMKSTTQVHLHALGREVALPISPLYPKPRPSTLRTLRPSTTTQTLFQLPTNKAISGPEADQWKTAMAEELQSLDRNKTWRLVKRAQLHRHTKVLGGKWVFKKKTNLTGKVVRYKARWVVKGYLQRYGRDYTQTYAGVAKSMTWKVIIAIATKFDWEIDQMDVVIAFLNGDANEEIYMDLPPGFTPPPEHAGDLSEIACRLVKALYGLKQSPRLWQIKLRSELYKLGLLPWLLMKQFIDILL